jgi:hypothetical protein
MFKVTVFFASFYCLVVGSVSVYLLSGTRRFVPFALSMGVERDVFIAVNVGMGFFSALVFLVVYDGTTLGKKFWQNRIETFVQFLLPLGAGVFAIVWMYLASETGILDIIPYSPALCVPLIVSTMVFMYIAYYWLRIFFQGVPESELRPDKRVVHQTRM